MAYDSTPSANKRCSQPFDCGSQFKCFRGFCIPVPECPENDNGCVSPLNECLEASQPEPLPDPDGPNCGLGDPNTDPYVRKDCVSDCTIFCDEWSKVSANLTPDTDLKGCNIDDACSVCRTCSAKESADPEAVQAAADYYDLVIAEVVTQKENLQDEHDEEMVAAALLIADTIQYKQDLQDEHDAKVLAGEPVDQAQHDADIQAVDDHIAKLYEQKDRLEEQHDEQIKLIDAYITQLYNEKAEHLVFLSKSRGICADIPVPERPCYCPSYIDPEGNYIDDAKNRECYLCDVDGGSWLYREDLCALSCDQCVVCDNGEEACGSAKKRPSDSGDVCSKARDAALRRCEEVEEVVDCKYPRRACKVTGPFSDAAFSWEQENIDFQRIRVLQTGGNTPLPDNNGVLASISLISAVNTPEGSRFRIRVIRKRKTEPNWSQLNGDDRQDFFTTDGEVTIGAPLELKIIGRPDVELLENKTTKQVGDTAQITTEDVTVPTVPNPSFEYTWFGDNKQLYRDLDGNITLSNKDESGYIIEGSEHIVETTPQLLLEEPLVGMYIQGAIRLPYDDPYRPSDEGWVKSEPFGLISPAPHEPIEAELFISADSSYNLYNAVIVDISSLDEYRPDIEPILVSWVDATTGENVGSGEYLYFSGPWALQKRYYPIATFTRNGEEQTITGPLTSLIGNTIPPSEDDRSEVPQSSSFNITGGRTQYDIVTLSGTYNTPNGISAGPFYSWYSNNELIINQTHSTLELTQEMVGTFISASLTYYDDYGSGITLTESLEDEVLNFADEPTGWIYITGEAEEGKQLKITDNIESQDGITDKEFVWMVDGLRIGDKYLSENGKTLYLSKGLDVVDTKITVAMVWKDTIPDESGIYRDHRIISDETFPVKRSNVFQGITLNVETLDSVEAGEIFNLDLSISAEDVEESAEDVEEPIPITSVLWALQIEPINVEGDNAGNLLRFTAGERPINVDDWPYNDEPEAAVAGPLVEDLWEGSVGSDCPDCWDCFETSTYRKFTAPLGSSIHHKCPYPGYPEITCAESKEANCKQLCIDYCWTYTTSIPSVDRDDRLVKRYSYKGTTYYVFLTCMATPEELGCVQDDGQLQEIGIFRLETPSWDYYECTCAQHFGPRQTMPSKVEFSRTQPGNGPWTINPEERKLLGWSVDEMAQDGVAFNDIETYGKLVSQSQYYYPDLGCQYGPYSGTGQMCPYDGFLGGGRIEREVLCGGNGKPNIQRGFIVTDSTRMGNRNAEIKSTIYHGYSGWPYGYRSPHFWINQNTDSAYGSSLPADQLPPECVEAPEFVGFYHRGQNVLRVTPQAYEELLALEEPDNVLFDFVPGATFVPLGTSNYPRTERPVRERKDTPVPIVRGPGSIYHDVEDGTHVAQMKGTTTTGEKAQSWRFTLNKGAISPDQVFAIDADGHLRLRDQSPPSGNYQFQVQARYKDLWSKNFWVYVTIVGGTP